MFLISAKTNEDLMFARWVHAQDRLWQMEMNRRVAMGDYLRHLERCIRYRQAY